MTENWKGLSPSKLKHIPDVPLWEIVEELQDNAFYLLACGLSKDSGLLKAFDFEPEQHGSWIARAKIGGKKYAHRNRSVTIQISPFGHCYVNVISILGEENPNKLRYC